MKPLTYVVEQSPRGWMIQFNRAIPQKYRTALESIGYKFSYQFLSFVGKKNKNKAVEIANDAVKYYAEKKERSRETLCCTCQNACGSCSWSKRLEPVKGWNAKKGNVSYIVLSCPKYIPDPPRNSIDDDDFDDEDYEF